MVVLQVVHVHVHVCVPLNIHVYLHVCIIIVLLLLTRNLIYFHTPHYTVNPLLVDDSLLIDTINPRILVSVSPLCQDDEYEVTVSFGTRPIGAENCSCQHSVTRDEQMASSTGGQIGWEIDVPDDTTRDTDEEYCFCHVVLCNAQGVVDVEGDIDGMQIYVLVHLTDNFVVHC